MNKTKESNMNDQAVVNPDVHSQLVGEQAVEYADGLIQALNKKEKTKC